MKVTIIVVIDWNGVVSAYIATTYSPILVWELVSDVRILMDVGIVIYPNTAIGFQSRIHIGSSQVILSTPIIRTIYKALSSFTTVQTESVPTALLPNVSPFACYILYNQMFMPVFVGQRDTEESIELKPSSYVEYAWHNVIASKVML